MSPSTDLNGKRGLVFSVANESSIADEASRFAATKYDSFMNDLAQ